jgi:hypothetical protein
MFDYYLVNLPLSVSRPPNFYLYLNPLRPAEGPKGEGPKARRVYPPPSMGLYSPKGSPEVPQPPVPFGQRGRVVGDGGGGAPPRSAPPSFNSLPARGLN